MALSLACPLALALGVVSHVCYFVKGEHHMAGPALAALVPLTWLVLVAARLRFETAAAALAGGTLQLAGYGLGLWGSMLAYRGFFHPLKDFPGPRLARVSKFWHVLQLSDLRNHLLLEKLRLQYGDVVRIGPNEVVVFRADGFAAIHGSGSRCTKAPFYDMLQKDRSIHATRQPRLHQARRRVWDQGFSTKSLHSYEARVDLHVQRLSAQIARTAGQGVDCTQLFLSFGFDVMGDIAFGEGFGMLQSQEHEAVQIMRSGMFLMGRLMPVSWLVTVLASLPGVNADFEKLESFARHQVLKRTRMQRDEADVMSRLIDAARDPLHKEKTDMDWLAGDALVIIVAGSDTVSIALTFLFYHLAQHPSHVATLRAELATLAAADARTLRQLPHLNALISETMRLFPPVITAPLRQTPPEGLQIGSHFIPGNATVSAPLWSLGRLESSYTNARDFVPERWYPGSDMVKDARGFAPFLSGTHSCVGKQLALMEIRAVTARLVTAYDFELAAEASADEVLDIRDCFTAMPGPLKLRFTPRAV